MSVATTAIDAPVASDAAVVGSTSGTSGGAGVPVRNELPDQQRRTARIVGALYLALFVIGPFAFFYVPGELFHDDAATTSTRIAADVGLFSTGLIAETIIVGIEVTLAGLLWKLFRPAGEALALSSSLARVGVAFIQAVNVLLAGSVLIIVDRGGLSGLTVDQRNEVVGFLIDAIGFGVMVWGLLFGLHLLLLGLLVRRSQLMPRWIGSLLLAASVGYLAQGYGHIVDTDLDGFFESLVVALSVPGELAFAGYLLFRGVRTNRPTTELR